jgi:hypothetical protein
MIIGPSEAGPQRGGVNVRGIFTTRVAEFKTPAPYRS